MYCSDTIQYEDDCLTWNVNDSECRGLVGCTGRQKHAELSTFLVTTQLLFFRLLFVYFVLIVKLLGGVSVEQ